MKYKEIISRGLTEGIDMTNMLHLKPIILSSLKKSIQRIDGVTAVSLKKFGIGGGWTIIFKVDKPNKRVNLGTIGFGSFAAGVRIEYKHGDHEWFPEAAAKTMLVDMLKAIGDPKPIVKKTTDSRQFVASWVRVESSPSLDIDMLKT